MLIIKADTPEECKAEIVAWLRVEATQNGIQARMSRKKTSASEYQQREKALLASANFLEHSIKVMPK